MIPLFFISPFIILFITKGKLRFLNKFELALVFALHYGTFILALPIFFLLYKTKQQPWNTLLQIALEPVVLSAYIFTFLTALLATIINAIFGLILAWVLVRYEFPGKKLLDATVDLPFALPTSVGGLTLMTVFNDKGFIKPICSWLNIKIVFNPIGVLLAMIFVSLPFVVRTIQPVLQNIEEDLEEAAWCLGASPWTTFWHILFPPLTPSLLTGTALGFSRALGEYGSIVLIASNIPMKDLVISVLLFQKLEQYDYPSAIIIASFVLIISFIALFFINQIQLWKKNFHK
uniref:Sulfate transport system permease protein CysT n=1 Tax=Dumortiera hirsuta TaxID=56917 RepID=A0A346M0T5_DUMHI|nr:probable sulfate transport system permease protein cysT [Dumortiera hirsuta]AXQ02630.1 probable sulfate transport system permease protein cysT [Dumortiera hirsuta]